MTVRKMAGAAREYPPSDLPDNVPVSYTTTYTKTVGNGEEADSVAETLDDYRDARWLIEKLADSGYEDYGEHQGRPYSHDLRRLYGVGRYKCYPIGANGPLKHLSTVEVVAPIQAAGAAKADAPAAPVDDLPPFMRMMLAQQAEERAEARRAAADAERRRQEWEREQAKREWERAERQERAERARAEKEAEERQLAADRTDKLLAAGMTLAGTLMQSITTAVAARPSEPRRDVNDALLAALLQSTRPSGPPAGGGIKDTLDMLLVLDQVAEKRAERHTPAPREEEGDKDEGLMKSLMGVLPMLMAMRGGGAVPQQAAQAMQALQAPGADPRETAETMVRNILSDPDALAAIASRDPDSTAQVFLAAVQRNPSLQAAVAKAFTEATGKD